MIDSHRVVAFADLAGYTALTEAHGDDGGADVALRFFEITTTLLRADARIVKTIGDAVMVVASDPHDGLHIGLALLRAVEREPHFPGVRIGVHYGPIVERNGDVFGATVNVAARLTAHAHVGQLLTSAAIAALVEEHTHLTTTALGGTWLKNVGEPVEIYSVVEHGDRSDHAGHGPGLPDVRRRRRRPRTPSLGRSGLALLLVRVREDLQRLSDALLRGVKVRVTPRR